MRKVLTGTNCQFVIRIVGATSQEVRFAVMNEMYFGASGGKQDGPVTLGDLRTLATCGDRNEWGESGRKERRQGKGPIASRGTSL